METAPVLKIFLFILTAFGAGDCLPECSSLSNVVCWGIMRCDVATSQWVMSGTSKSNCCYDFQCNMPKNNKTPMRYVCRQSTGTCVETLLTNVEFNVIQARREGTVGGGKRELAVGDLDPSGIMIGHDEVVPTNELNPEVAEARKRNFNYDDDDYEYYYEDEYYGGDVGHGGNLHYYHEYPGEEATGAYHAAASREPYDLADFIDNPFGLPNFLRLLGKKK